LLVVLEVSQRFFRQHSMLFRFLLRPLFLC
jgi:hypothetical protein